MIHSGVSVTGSRLLAQLRLHEALARRGGVVQDCDARAPTLGQVSLAQDSEAPTHRHQGSGLQVPGGVYRDTAPGRPGRRGMQARLLLSRGEETLAIGHTQEEPEPVEVVDHFLGGVAVG